MDLHSGLTNARLESIRHFQHVVTAGIRNTAYKDAFLHVPLQAGLARLAMS